MTRATVSCYGDPFAGIPGIVTSFDLGFKLDKEDEESVREVLIEAFSIIWDDSAEVNFDVC